MNTLSSELVEFNVKVKKMLHLVCLHLGMVKRMTACSFQEKY